MKRYRNYIILHIIVLVFGFTGIIGALVKMSPDILIAYRTLMAGTVIYIYGKFKGISFSLNTNIILKLLATGIIIAIHWVGFYGAIKVSNVSVTLACFASSSFFAALLEPIIYKRRIDIKEIMFGVLVMCGISLIFTINFSYTLGILLALLAAFTSALFTIINGTLIGKIDAIAISFYEMLGGFIFIMLYFLFAEKLNTQLLDLSSKDWFLILILSVFCTAITFVMAIEIMKEISPYTVVLTVNLEPVYGIILAYFILNEGDKLNWKFYLAALFILIVVFLNTYLKSRRIKSIDI